MTNNFFQLKPNFPELLNSSYRLVIGILILMLHVSIVIQFVSFANIYFTIVTADLNLSCLFISHERWHSYSLTCMYYTCLDAKMPSTTPTNFWTNKKNILKWILSCNEIKKPCLRLEMKIEHVFYIFLAELWEKYGHDFLTKTR